MNYESFSLPMFRPWVPERVRPWLLCALALSFQMCSGVYLGGMSQMMGTRDMMREDVLMCLYATLAGLALMFPVLMRHKFAFTNKRLLLVSALGIAACNVAAMRATSLPLLWGLCFITGALKIQGTFECLSNLRLWFAPKGDPRAFFPCIHLFIMGSVALSDMLAIYLCYVATWHYMTYLMTGLMLLNALWVMALLRPFRIPGNPFPPSPLDWLGAVLWAGLVLQLAFIFCYGEYYDWWTSPVIRTLAATSALTLALAAGQTLLHPSPYISHSIWHVRRLPLLLGMLVLIEMVLASETVLEEMYFEGAMGWDAYMRRGHHWPVIAGVVAACGVSYLWLRVLGWGRVRLAAAGMAAFAAYALAFHFGISPQARMESFAAALFLRSFAATVLGAVLLVCLAAVMDFPRMFHALAVFQVLHIVLGGVIGAALVAYGARYLMADALARHAGAVDALALSPMDMPARLGPIMRQLQMVTVKQLYGLAAYAALSLAALLLLWDIAGRRIFSRGA